MRDSLASIDAAREALGYVPTIGVEEGIELTIDWYRSRRQENSRRLSKSTS